MTKYLTLFAMILSPWIAFGHDGHGIFNGSRLEHYLTSPEHILWMIPVLALLAFYVKKKIFENQKQ